MTCIRAHASYVDFTNSDTATDTAMDDCEFERGHGNWTAVNNDTETVTSTDKD